jgi:nucleoside 2-deoxyribosyltransferase
MITSGARIQVTLAQLGALKSSEANNAREIANQVQGSFDFLWGPELQFDKSAYLFPNGSYDLCRAVKDLPEAKTLPRPLILLSSLPFGAPDCAEEKDGFLFSHQLSFSDPDVAIVSTHLWQTLPGHRGLQRYFLVMFAGLALKHCSGLAFHEETRGCFLDECENASDIDQMFTSEGICDDCEAQLEAKIRKGLIRIEQVASVKRLFKRAFGRKVCFVAMPFEESLLPIYDRISEVFRQKHWTIVRADEIARPRRITDKILLAIQTSDMVLADLTGSNPNVFYELGLAHAVGADVILLTQEDHVPFDIATEQTIFYKTTEPGLKKLEKQIAALARTGASGG